MMKRYFLRISYKGTSYSGWQTQPCGNTVQDYVEGAFGRVYKKVKVVGSSRTDAGVHAYGQVAHVDLPESVDMVALMARLNAVLPLSIRIDGVREVKATTHARYDARFRVYVYHIMYRMDPFSIETSYSLGGCVDVSAMNKVCELLLGERSFRSFCKKKSCVPHYRCRVAKAYWRMMDGGYCFLIRANRFLHGMVRSLVGTMLDVGRGRLSLGGFEEVLRAEDRCVASQSVPAQGLFLQEVSYETDCYVDSCVVGE